MKCPHCQIRFHPEHKQFDLGLNGRTPSWQYHWRAKMLTCPACSGPIVFVSYLQDYGPRKFPGEDIMAFPRQAAKPPAPKEVPEKIAKDFNEASAVLALSAQASAALSRRCLQHLLLDMKISSSNNLSQAIDAALKSNLPSHLAENLDAIRNIGNFAAHPLKAEHTGEVIPVEPEEAEWNLDVLEMLFDFYYVQPSIASKRRENLNAKLAESGKAPMKAPL